MTSIKNGNTEITLKASAGAYRKLKLMQGCLNLKAAFFAACWRSSSRLARTQHQASSK